MKPPYEIDFDDSLLSIERNIEGNLPEDCSYPMHTFSAERYTLENATILRQYHKTSEFFIETYAISNSRNLSTSFTIKRNRLFLFIMLKGDGRFTDENGKLIRVIKEKHIGVAYNKTGKYCIDYKSSKKTRILIVIAFKRKWLTSTFSKYPHLESLFQSFKKGKDRYKLTLPCKANGDILTLIREFYALNSNNPGEFNGNLKVCISRILEHLNGLIDEKMKFPHVRAKFHIDDHYHEPDITVQFLADKFNITDGTLSASFKKEFDVTLIAYLSKVRLERARHLIIIEKLRAKRIYTKVGYKDLGNFGRQFKKEFGYTPGRALEMDCY